MDVSIVACFDPQLFFLCFFQVHPLAPKQTCTPFSSPPFLFSLCLCLFHFNGCLCLFGNGDATREPMLGCTGWSPAAVLWICLHGFHWGVPWWILLHLVIAIKEKTKKRKNLIVMALTLGAFWTPFQTNSSIWHPHIILTSLQPAALWL